MTTRWRPQPETLPGILAEIAGLVGVDKALHFAATYGGELRYIPKKVEADHWLATVLGLKAARILATRHAGQQVSIPSAKVERHAIQARELYARGHSLNAIVRRTGLSITRVKKLVTGVERDIDAVSITSPVGDRAERRQLPKPRDDRQMLLDLK